MKFIAGTDRDRISKAICRDAGVDPTMVRRIVVDLEAGSVGRIYFETFADDEKLAVSLEGGLRIVGDANS